MRAAFGTILRRQVKAGAVAAVGDKFGMLAFRTDIVRTQRIDLGDARHGGDKGRADRTTRADQIAVRLTVGNELLRGHIEHGKAVGRDGVQLLVEPCLDDFGQRITVLFLGAFPCDGNKLFLCALDKRREGALWNRADILAHIGNFVGIGDDHLIRLFLAQPLKLLEHFGGGTEIQRRLLVGVPELLCRLQNLAVLAVVRIDKMHVTGGANRLVQLLAELDDGAVNLTQLVKRAEGAVADQKLVVAGGLDLKIVIKRRDLLDLAPGLAA